MEVISRLSLLLLIVLAIGCKKNDSNNSAPVSFTDVKWHLITRQTVDTGGGPYSAFFVFGDTNNIDVNSYYLWRPNDTFYVQSLSYPAVHDTGVWGKKFSDSLIRMYDFSYSHMFFNAFKIHSLTSDRLELMAEGEIEHTFDYYRFVKVN